MRLQKVSRTASAVGRLIASPSANARVEPVQRAEPTRDHPPFMLRRRLPDRQPDEPTERGTFLNIVV
ncbi:MAG: hypothetical protein ACFCVH_07165 [Alphaproteobacteria bacterium]